MITGNIRFAPETPLISGNRKASRIKPPGSPNLLSSAFGEPAPGEPDNLFPSPALYRRAVAQKTPGPEDQDQDQDGEDDDVRPANADVLVGHRADDADEDAAHDRPGEIPYPPQSGGRKREEPLPDAQIEDGGAVEEPKHDARGPGEDATKKKGHGDSAVDVYPHHRRRLLVLRHGAHRFALPGAPNEVREAEEQRYRHEDDEQVLPAVGARVGDPGEGVAVGDQ